MDGTAPRVIARGNIYWMTLDTGEGPEAAIPHPYVVVQDDVFNHSRIHTVVVCALTSNLQRVSETPGNVLLEPGEGDLPRQSVIEVSKVSSVEKAQLGEYIGALSQARVEQILAGMHFLQATWFNRQA
jgi:mRNA interferase MazF